MADTSSNPVLLTLAVSHFCEKARWVLERCGIEYTEEAHVPVAHRFAVKTAGGRGSVPCLRLPPETSGPDSRSASASAKASISPGCVDQSTPIMRWADQQRPGAALFPAGPRGAEVERWCAQLDKRLGPATRSWAYSHVLYNPMVADAMVAPPVPAAERFLLRWGGWLLVRKLLAKGLRISPENGAVALQEIRRCFDEVGQQLADGRPFLTGETFTAADITFAALAAPAIGQAYANVPGLSEQTPPAMRTEVEELQAHPAGQFALRLWREQRAVVVPAARPSAL
ncbi:glutathione S-transferase [Chlorella sorokiniana]|uniref:Glutathione S-transferase n=1 Tax=Chlorella sorokiniana TaxID=3076 RepID=A0A2P6TSQ3_CHLSO|nr:glutathione S-transferase [Chlorella sorokiniana]|eukprot:PRW57097.1 glutathione S-transferase [Chlorella sorokiniana]